MKELIEKECSPKGSVLIGEDEQGVRYWLAAPSWDCGWYWGFGYIQTKDSHEHFKGFVGYQEKYDGDKKVFVKDEYVHNIWNNKRLVKTTFTEKEGWTLSELFKTFYHLKESAEVFGKGGSHISANPCASVIQNKDWAKHINEVMIPAVTKQIMEILKP
jgi:hypothetical protein